MKNFVLTPVISREEKAVETVVSLWKALRQVEADYGQDSKSADRARSRWSGALSVIDAMGLREEYIQAIIRP